MATKKNIQKLKKISKNPLRIIIGGFFLVLGFIGALLPILQGWIFFLIGLAIIFEESIIEKIKKLWKKR